jgi:hypothetical protein
VALPALILTVHQPVQSACLPGEYRNRPGQQSCFVDIIFTAALISLYKQQDKRQEFTSRK